MGKTVLLVKGCDQTERSASRLLVQCGFAVLLAQDDSSAFRLVQSARPACVVVPVAGQAGVELCRVLRGQSKTPMLAISEHGDEQLVVRCLEAGADSVLIAPLSRRVLGARIDAMLRTRTGPRRAESQREVYCVGDLVIDTDAHVATRSGRPLSLTPTEFRLLVALTRRAGRMASHADLLSEVWGPAYGDRPELVRLYIRYLRRKLGDDRERPSLLLNQRGVGYRLGQSSTGEANVA